MTNLSNSDALNALIAAYEGAVADLANTRTQSALEAMNAARTQLLVGIETVRIGGRIAE